VSGAIDVVAAFVDGSKLKDRGPYLGNFPLKITMVGKMIFFERENVSSI
jgi:hypothetical protein